MSKVAIVGVEGSGKTVLMAAFAEQYGKVSESSLYLMPENQSAFSFMTHIPHLLRKECTWPQATTIDSLDQMKWTVRVGKEILSEIELLDYPGELYRLAFGERKQEEIDVSRDEVHEFLDHVIGAELLVVLLNLSDVLEIGGNARNSETVWITRGILEYASKISGIREVLIVFTQADRYSKLLETEKGANNVLSRHLPMLTTLYPKLEALAVSAVDAIDEKGNPKQNYSSKGIDELMRRIVQTPAERGALDEAMAKCEACAGFMLASTSKEALLQAIDRYRNAINLSVFKQKAASYLLPPNYLSLHTEELASLSHSMGIKVDIIERTALLDEIEQMTHPQLRLDKIPDPIEMLGLLPEFKSQAVEVNARIESLRKQALYDRVKLVINEKADLLDGIERMSHPGHQLDILPDLIEMAGLLPEFKSRAAHVNAQIESIRKQAFQELHVSIRKDFETHKKFLAAQPTSPALDPVFLQYVEAYCCELTDKNNYQLAWQNLLKNVQALYEKSVQEYDFTSALSYAMRLDEWDQTVTSSDRLNRTQVVFTTFSEAIESVKCRDYCSAVLLFKKLIEQIGDKNASLSVGDWNGTLHSLHNRARAIVLRRRLVRLSAIIVLLALVGLTTHLIRRLVETNRVKQMISTRVFPHFLSPTGSVIAASAELEEIKEQSKRTEQVLANLLQYWLRRSVEQGDADAATILGVCFEQGFGIKKNDHDAVCWYRQAAEKDHLVAQDKLGNCYKNGLGVDTDFVEAVKWYRSAAEQDYAPSQYNLGRCYEGGLGVDKNLVEAAKWYQKAAEQDYAIAQHNLGLFYMFGLGVEKDLTEAIKWFRKAAEQGCAVAQYNLGLCYENGWGGNEDLVEAANWFRKAAEQDFAGAQNLLGDCYANGSGVSKDLAEAVSWYRKAAEQGDARAQYSLGKFYGHGLGVHKDFGEAVKWFRKAAEQGVAGAQYYLGYCYEDARGVSEDLVEAVKWYRKAAEQDNAGAQINLGRCYMFGSGVEKDLIEATKWYRKAAEQGEAKGQFCLGLCYANVLSVDKGFTQFDMDTDGDLVEALKWYEKAAEQGVAGAQHCLGICYANGLGVSEDMVVAVKWFSKAAEQDYAASQFELGRYYTTGSGVDKDVVEGAKWYRKAAEQGEAGSQYSLGKLYQFGMGVEEDVVEAEKWYRKAAEQAEERAQYSLAILYEYGMGVDEDVVEAEKWYRKAAEQGEAGSQYSLGKFYEYGLGVDKDMVKAEKWYRKAAEQGVVRAADRLGKFYTTGLGVDKDLVEAVKWYRQASEFSFPPSQYSLGNCYKNGLGVEKDLMEATKWYRKAAEQGYADAQFALALCYKNGLDVYENVLEMVKWYRKAAEQGHAIAQNNLAWCYQEGRGVRRDLTEAIKWYRKAAEQGQLVAQNHLGYYYENGLGVNKNLAEAEKWYRKAAEQGNKKAQENLDRLKARRSAW